MKIPHAATKTRHSQINKYIFRGIKERRKGEGRRREFPLKIQIHEQSRCYSGFKPLSYTGIDNGVAGIYFNR